MNRNPQFNTAFLKSNFNQSNGKKLPEVFGSSMNSSVRIDSAVQKGRERLRLTDRRSSNFSANSIKSSVSSNISTEQQRNIINQHFNNSIISSVEDEEKLVEIVSDFRFIF